MRTAMKMMFDPIIWNSLCFPFFSFCFLVELDGACDSELISTNILIMKKLKRIQNGQKKSHR